MILSGNLIKNGDFESGSIEGWAQRPHGLGNNFITFEIDDNHGINGSKCLKLQTGYNVDCYYIYDSYFDMEDYDALVYTQYMKCSYSDDIFKHVVYYYDDTQRLIKHLDIDAFTYTNYKPQGGFIRVKYNSSIVRIGGMCEGSVAYATYYLDNVSLRQVNNQEKFSYIEDLYTVCSTSTHTDYIHFFVVGACDISVNIDVYSENFEFDSGFNYYLNMVSLNGRTYRLFYDQFVRQGDFKHIQIRTADIAYLYIRYEQFGTLCDYHIKNNVIIKPI